MRRVKKRKTESKEFNMKKIVALCALLAWIVPLRAETISDGGEYLRKNVVDVTLSNGIKVQLLNRGYSPTLSLYVSFNVGSADEDSESEGCAHMLEHMLFKGTPTLGTKDYSKEKPLVEKIEAIGETIDYLERVNPGNTRLPDLRKEFEALQKEHAEYVELNPYSRIYAELGGVGFNAFTSKDMTAYVISLPSSALEKWAEVETDRLRNPVFRQFYLERGAVVQERLMRYDSEGGSNLIEKFTATAFLAHPYRHPVIGWESQVRYLSPKATMRFYRDYYTTDAMNITIVGKQDVKQTIALLEKTFGKIPVSHRRHKAITTEPKQNGERRVTVVFDEKPTVIIAYHKPTLPSREDYVFDVISSILADGKNSRLYRSLVQDRKICADVDAGNGYPGAKFDNLFIVSGDPAEGISSAEVEKSLYAEIERLKTDVTADEINRVVTKLRADRIFKLDSNASLAREINYFSTVAGSWRYEADYLEAIRSVTPDEIRKVIETYLVPENRTVGILVPAQKGKKNEK